MRGTVCPRIPVPVGPQVGVGHKRNWHEIWPVGLKQQPLCSEGGLEGTLVAHTRYHRSVSSPGGWGQQLDPQLLQFQVGALRPGPGSLSCFVAKGVRFFCRLLYCQGGRPGDQTQALGGVCLPASCPASLLHHWLCSPIASVGPLPEAETTDSHRLLHQLPQRCLV